MNEPVLRSRVLADLAGTTPRALRHYHSIGLLPDVPRDPNGYRRYSPGDLVRVLRIRQLATSGMPLRRIRTMLDRDARSQDELLAELDRDLAQQADRIEAQRAVLAEVRRLSPPRPRADPGEAPTSTERFDRDVWTLVTATGGIDADSAAAMLEVLDGEGMVDEVADVYTEFEQLAGQTEVDEDVAGRLAARLLALGEHAMEVTGFAPSDEETPVAAMIQQMQAEALSPAQQQVWAVFLA